MGKAFIQESTLTDIANAIRGKNGSSDTYLPSEMAAAITAIPTGGGGTVAEKDVNFYDYDGKIVYSYTKAEALLLSALPTTPDHGSDNLTSDGWNYTLAEMITYVTTYGKLNIGAMYHTTDGAMHITCEADAEHLNVSLNLGSTVNDAVSVNWGDSSPVETWAGTSVQRKTHTFASAGVYDIKVMCSSGNIVLNSYLCGNKTVTGSDGTTKTVNSNSDSPYTHIYLSDNISALGNNCFQYCTSLQSVSIPLSVTSIGNYTFNYCTSLKSISIPSSVISLGSSCFQYCTSLQSVSIPLSVTSIGSNLFNYCTSLKSISIPSSVISLGRSCFQYCISLQSVSIPLSVTSIGNYCFSSCTSLQSVTIPSSVTSIGNYCFSSCDNLTQYHSLSITPPALVATNALTVSDGVTIYVPTGSLNDYQTAQYWSTWAAKMTEE